MLEEAGCTFVEVIDMSSYHVDLVMHWPAFREVKIVPERFPVKSRLHGGWKGAVYNGLFVGTFNALPRALVRRFGWHLLAFCRK